MRLSRYTTVLSVTNSHYAIFSALADKFLICHKNILKIHSGNKYKALTETLEKQLIEIDAVCEDNFDEISYLKNLIDATDSDKSEFHLHINPTLNCNFRCWYCYEEHQIKSLISQVVVDGIISFANKEITENKYLKTFTLSFFGGEPLMYYHKAAELIITKIRDICHDNGVHFRCHFTTNGYLLSGTIIQSLKNTDVSFQITLDGSRECHNKVRYSLNGNGTYDIILHNAILLAQDHHDVLLRINYTIDNIKHINGIIEDLLNVNNEIRRYIQIDFQRVWQDKPTITESEILTIISDLAKVLNNLGFICTYMANLGHDHVLNSCYGDKRNHVLVNYDGNLFFCTARDFKSENRFGVLNKDGSIEWNKELYNSFFTNKFSKRICHICKIAPLCGGGCRQRGYESRNEESCIYGYSQEDINHMIFNRLIFRYIKD